MSGTRNVENAMGTNGYFAYKERVNLPFMVLKGTLRKKGNLIQSWKTREFQILQNEVFRYIDPVAKECKGELSLTKCSIEPGNPLNLDMSGVKKAGAVSVNLFDHSQNPPRMLEMVLESEKELKELAYAIHLVSPDNNIKDFYVIRGWNVDTLKGFKPRLADRHDIGGTTACCCIKQGCVCENLSRIGCADYTLCCCLEAYCQFGLKRGNSTQHYTLSRLDQTTQNCFTSMCNFCSQIENSKGNYSSIESSFKKFDSQHSVKDCMPFIYNSSEESCCCGIFELPFCQARFSQGGPCCKNETSCCCSDHRCSVPTDDDVPCEIACCGIFCYQYAWPKKQDNVIMTGPSGKSLLNNFNKL